jgi:hypothetical protein
VSRGDVYVRIDASLHPGQGVVVIAGLRSGYGWSGRQHLSIPGVYQLVMMTRGLNSLQRLATERCRYFVAAKNYSNKSLDGAIFARLPQEDLYFESGFDILESAR